MTRRRSLQGARRLFVAAAVASTADVQAQTGVTGGPAPSVSSVVTQTSTDKAGYETYQVGVLFGERATDVYALYGQKGDPLIIPPAYQVATPFGSSVGPVNDAFLAVRPDAAFDSWLTIGIDGPALIPNALSSVGLTLDSWSETQGINADNGAVFFMDPSHGATVEPVVFAQLTVPAGTQFEGQVSAQGRSSGGDPDWDITALHFSNAPGAATTEFSPLMTAFSDARPARPTSGYGDDGGHRSDAASAAALALNTGSADPAGIPTRQIALAADGSVVMMPVISLGAAHFGADTSAVVEQWLTFGGRGIDTSGDYSTQPDVGAALARTKVARSDIFITSKLSQDGMASYDAAIAEVQQTLTDLQTSYIDLFLVHRAGADAAQRRETWRAMEHLRETGVVKAIGVSNWFVAELEDIVRDPATTTLPAVNQVKFHAGMWLPREGVEHTTKEYCDQHGITFEAYSPLGVGGVLQDPNLQTIATAHQKTAAQVALRWLVQHGAVACPGADTLQYMQEDAGLFDWSLSDAEMGQLDGIAMACDRSGVCTYSDAAATGGRGHRGGRTPSEFGVGGAFANAMVGSDALRDCTMMGLAGVSDACPPAAAGQMVPSSCPAGCATLVNGWYGSCTATEHRAAMVRMTDQQLGGQLMRLVNLCATATAGATDSAGVAGTPAAGGGH